MTPDLLAALRETPGCGLEVPHRLWGGTHRLAVRHAGHCDPCLTRLAEAVLNHYGPTIMELAPEWAEESTLKNPVRMYPDWPSLLATLRSETPR